MIKFSKSSFYFSFIFFSYTLAWSQVDTAWVRSYNGSGNGYDESKALVVDDSGNVYVTGRSLGSGSLDNFATLKYNSNGDTLWTRSYNGLGNGIDVATSIAVDNSGNVYATGYTDNGSSDDFTTIKYSSTGDTVWVRNYNGPGDRLDQAHALAIDNSGNVYVTGSSRGSGGTLRDYATIKYSSIGDTLWVRRYDGPAGGQDDDCFAIALDNSGYVYVTGYSRGVGSGRDYTTIKYNSVGDTLWVRRYDGPGNGNDIAVALKVDNVGNVYTTGYSTGVGTGFDYATVKRNSLGDTLWVRRYNGPGFGDDSAKAIVIDSSGDVYVTGSSVGSGTGYDYTTIKYNSIGDTLWLRLYNGAGNGADLAQALALDFQGNLYVTGYSWNGSSYDYLTIKYNSIGDTVWTRSYNGTGNGDDIAQAISVDKFLNLYLTGYSWNGGSYDYVTLKYIQNWAPLLDSIGSKIVAEGSNLTFRVHSSDIDGDSLILTAINLPANATFIDSGNGAGSFSFNPDYTQAGLFAVTFKATDGIVMDSEVVNMTVTNTNRAPVLDSIGSKIVAEGSNLTFRVHSSDLDGDSLILTAVNLPANATFLDSGNGAGSFSFNPDFSQAGFYTVTFRCTDGVVSDSEIVNITVTNLCLAKSGDLNADGLILLPDIVILVSYLYRAGAAPSPLCTGDANADGNINLADIIYLTNFVFKAGPAPLSSLECCL
ncbi:MAG: hypothetical protein RBG1_1C00001G0184 [candidate division Zixibacteria bacterium RBG-1]|nr:MAG: hypothetical protein RBG1_1C00001G0184 [candidate division Zixibacteria bacterium RBG-1]OGC83978.1 MAG: hypothetical protein A2V73_07480 [candidate division Zixibacteria bacterium RBG_19FT_COMBO_42_43]